MSPAYEEFDALVGRLKRAAIDAYMDDYGFSAVGGDYTKTEVSDGGFPLSATTVVDRPGEDGNGGGAGTRQVTMSPTPDVVSYHERFDQVRSQIDALVQPWRDLPSPAQIQVVEQQCVTLNTGFAGTASFSQGNVGGVGIIATNLDQVRTNSQAFTGRTGERFKSQFLGRIGAVCGGLWAMSVLATTMVHVQAKMWEAARQDVADALDIGKVAMAGSCNGAQERLNMSLKVDGIVIKVAKEFVPGLAGAALGTAGIALDLLQDATAPEANVPQMGGGTYEEVLKSFTDTLNTINEQITAQERLINDTLVRNLAAIQAAGKTIRHPDDGTAAEHANPYDVEVPPISSTKGVRITNYDLVAGIWQECLPKVSHELKDLAVTSRDCMTWEALQRNAGIGIALSGPSVSFGELTWKLCEMANDLAWDVTMGAKDLKLVVTAMREHDEASAAKLRKFAESMSRPGPYDAWD